MGGVAKILNTENNKTYIFSTSRDIYKYVDEVETKLKNDWHSNKELQQDYNKNPNAFEFEVLHVNNSPDEINRLQSIEIDKYWPNGYNKRRGNVSYDGGNTNPFVKKGLNEKEFVMTDFMEELFANLNESDISQESKNIIKEKIENGDIKSKFGLNTEIRYQKRKEKFLDIVNKSGLKSKDKEKLKREIKNDIITSQYSLKKEIESILNSYKTNSKSKTAVKKNNSSRNKKPKKESNKNDYTDKQKTISTPKSNNDFIVCPCCGELCEKTRNFCNVCGVNLSGDDIICPECGRALDEDETFCKVCGISLENINIRDCPNCGNACHRIDMFCDSCGFPLNDIKCPNCGATWNKNKTSCKKCGFSLEDSNFIVCPKCSNVCSKDENYCGFCGFEFKRQVSNLIEEMQKRQREKSEQGYNAKSQKNNESMKKGKKHGFDQFLIDTFGSILSVEKDGEEPRLSFSKCMGFLFFLLSLAAAILTVPVYGNFFMIIPFLMSGLIFYSFFRGIGAVFRFFKD